MRTALVQQRPPTSGVVDAVNQAIDHIHGHPGADLIVLSELFIGGCTLESLPNQFVELDGPEVGALRKAAAEARSAVVLGVALLEDNRAHNVALVLESDGSVAGIHRKTHQWAKEERVFAAGQQLNLISVGGLRVGFMVCFEMEFPEIARDYATAGADLLVTISANMSPFRYDHWLHARARALENTLPHIYVNRCGSEDGEEYVGGSGVYGVDGRPLVELGPDPCVVDVEVDVETRAKHYDYLTLRQPTLYSPR